MLIVLAILIKKIISLIDYELYRCYHDGEHYCSVRSKEDSCEGPAKPIMIKVQIANL